MEFGKVLEIASSKYPQKVALSFQDQSFTFLEVKAQSEKLAAALQALGVRPGTKVAMYLPNCPEYVFSYCAVFLCGAVGVPLDFMLKDDELISCLEHSETEILIAFDKKGVDYRALRSLLPRLKMVILIHGDQPGCETYSTILTRGQGFQPVKTSEGDPALIMYTSGTTGRPKGILLTYRHLDGSPEAMKHFVDLSSNDVKLAAIPLSHIGGFIYVQNCLMFGITLILMDRFNPFEFLKLIQEHRVTCFHIVPPMYNAILTLKQIEQFDLSSLRWVVVFGAPSSPEIMERFHKYCPNAKLLNGWGMTETCPPNTVTPMDSDNIASVGKPAPHCEIKNFDDEGRECPAGEIGEIVIRGWIVMKEYYKDPEETSRVLKNGWLYTGDLGRFDQDGFLYIVGRKKEMIKVGGQIVYAPEVEAALYKHDGVAEAAVIGIPDAMKGEAVKAFVVLKDGAGLSAEDIRYFARQHLANFKVPQSVTLLDHLPKNRTGKIDKQALKEGVPTS